MLQQSIIQYVCARQRTACRKDFQLHFQHRNPKILADLHIVLSALATPRRPCATPFPQVAQSLASKDLAGASAVHCVPGMEATMLKAPRSCVLAQNVHTVHTCPHTWGSALRL